jgi:hypothetical protein
MSEQKFKEFSTWATLPFYSSPSVLIGLVITNDFKKSHENRGAHYTARCLCCEGEVHYEWRSQAERRFIIFIDYAYLTYGLIGHELDHVRQMIVKELKITCDEAMAKIAGWLHAWVYWVLSLNSVPIYHQAVEIARIMPSNWQEPIDDETPF